MNTKSLFVSAGIVLLMTACTQKPVEEQHDGYTLIHQDGPRWAILLLRAYRS